MNRSTHQLVAGVATGIYSLDCAIRFYRACSQVLQERPQSALRSLTVSI